MRYDAFIDKWVAFLFWGLNIMFGAMIFFVPMVEMWIYLISVIPMIIIMTWLMIGSYYDLREEEIYMKLGPFFGRIKYKNIKSVQLKNTWASSMAMTNKCIEIKVHNKGFIMGTTYIGPKDREEFLYDLVHRCPNLENKTKIDDDYS